MEDLSQTLYFYLNIGSHELAKYSKPKPEYFYYKRITIPKRNGGIRTIYAPIPELKRIQHFLRERYLSTIDISPYSYAYVRGNSITHNARTHIKNSHFLFVDIRDFFDSIDFETMYEIMSKKLSNVLPANDIRLMLKLCSHENKFVQGCVTSPVISNIYMFNIDMELSRLAASLPSGVYSRYSDDIVVSSSERICEKTLESIQELLRAYHFKINDRKTRFSSYVERVKITGVRIKNNHAVSLDTHFKKSLKNSIFHKLKYGQDSRESIDSIIGKLSYLKMVDLVYYNILNIKYKKNGKLLIDILKEMNKAQIIK